MTDEKNPTKTSEEALAEAPEKVAPAQENPEAQKGKDEEKGKEGVAPAPETITKEEHERVIGTIKGGHKGTTEKLTGDIKALKTSLGEIQERYEEQERAGWLAKIEQDGGDVSTAKAITERDKESKKNERDFAERLANIESREVLLNEAGKSKSAYDLIRTHGLGEGALEGLLKSESLVEMENMALKLKLDKQGADSRPSETPDKGQKASTKGQDLTKVPVDRRLGMLMEGEL